MRPTITEKTFYQFLKCPTWVYFDAQEIKHEHDALLERLMDDGLLPEVQREVLRGRSFVEVDVEDQEEACLRTLELMKAGEQTILRGTLAHGHWVGHPDILERVEGQSRFGSYYYVACDIKRDRQLKDVYKFQGAFYAELLWRVQNVHPTRGYVLTPDGAVLSYDLEPLAAEFHLNLEEIERILAGQRPPHFLTSGCKQSPWFKECRNASLSCDDLSLINRVWRSEVAALRQAGLDSTTALAASNPDLLAAQIPTISRDRLYFLRTQAVSLLEGRTIVMNSIAFPPAREEIYFDVESDPLRDFDFLFGVLRLDKSGEEYRSFVADRLEKEEEVWRSFLTYLSEHREAVIYHFGWYEIEVMRRLGVRYDCQEVVERIVTDQMRDLLMLIRDAIIFPLYFYSLKDIARLLGFSWREAGVSGLNVVFLFEQFLKTRRRQILTRIITYNEDDCRATALVKKWSAEQTGE